VKLPRSQLMRCEGADAAGAASDKLLFLLWISAHQRPLEADIAAPRLSVSYDFAWYGHLK